VQIENGKKEPISFRHEYVVGSIFNAIVEFIKSYGAFVHIGEHVGMLHINHVQVTSMETMIFFLKFEIELLNVFNQKFSFIFTNEF
jgi:ribosomal protein S1